MATRIAIYADWNGLPAPLRLGVLHAQRGAGRDIFEFAFDVAALAHPAVLNLQLDPRLGLFEGRQHPPQGNETFGVFADASPDRWGRLLMRRRLEREQRAGQVDKKVRLYESDYLLGVHDAFRVGAKTADAIIERNRAIVKQWPKIATQLGVPAREQARMASAFQLAV